MPSGNSGIEWFNAVANAKLKKQGQGLQQQKLDQQGAFQQQELQEKIREFNESMGFKQKQLDAGYGGGRQPAIIKEQQAANRIIDKYNARDPKTGNVDLSKIPGMERFTVSSLLNKIQKSSQSSLASKQALFGRNMMQTLGKIDPSILSYYSGVAGKGRYGRDLIESMMPGGKAPHIFNQYRTYQNSTIPLLADQMTKYFAGSVQSEAMKQRLKSINVDGWSSNPDLAAKNFNSLKEILTAEYQNTIATLNNPATNTDASIAPEIPASPFVRKSSGTSDAEPVSTSSTEAPKLTDAQKLALAKLKKKAQSNG